MQLIYLYVEKYKNIDSQGFNFGSRFNCKFDKQANELTISENKNYIENFFDENIEITAIVGENGAGKSSIAELLIDFSYQEHEENKSFLVYFNGTNFCFKQSISSTTLSFKVFNKTNYEYINKSKPRTIDTIYFSNSIASIFNNPKFLNYKTYSNLDAYYEYNTNLMLNNKYSEVQDQQAKRMEIFSRRFLELLKKDKKIFSILDEKLVFNAFRIELHFYELGAYLAGDKRYESLGISGDTIFNESNSKTENTSFFKLLILFRLLELESKADSNLINKVIDFFNEQESDFNNCLSFFNGYDDESIYSQKNINEIIEDFKLYKKEIWIKHKNNNLSDDPYSKNELLNLLIKKIGRIEFVNSLFPEYNYFSLSAGEREIITFFVTLIHHMISNKTQFVYVFDEIELGLHPSWQKQMIKIILTYVKRYNDNKKNFIFTTHSPFLLSDIPNQNIVFLKEGKQVDAFKKENTFGANIHTLLSDSFFMSNGLMGEFAKNKIEEVISFINSDESEIKTIEEAQKIINIIGEPVLKREIQRMLDSKNLNEIEYIKKDIEKLEARLKELENGKN